MGDAVPRCDNHCSIHSVEQGMAATQAKITSAEYWAQKGSVKLYVYRKRAANAVKGAPVLFLVHGSSASGRSSFDLNVPGRDDYSLMDHFAGLGYDVWTVDHEGYGRSDRTDSNSNIASGAQDLAAAMSIVERETGAKEVCMYGGSSGALRAALYAQQNPGCVKRLMVSALVYTGEGSPTLAKRREKVEEYRASPRRKVDRAFIHSMFTRDKPGTSEMIAADALADAELPLGDTVPTGTYLDMCAHLPVIDPLKINCPVCIIRGEYDGIAAEPDLLNFFGKLPGKDKQFVFVSGLAHAATLGINRHKFWHAMKSFMNMPGNRELAS